MPSCDMAGRNWGMVDLSPSIHKSSPILYKLQPPYSVKSVLFLLLYYIGECIYYWDTMGIIEGSGTCILLILCVLDMYLGVLK